MKKVTIILTLLIAVLTACEESLNFEVKDKVTLENYFQNAEDAVSSVNAVYDALGDVDLYNSTLWLIQDIASDDCDALSTWNDPNAHQLDRYTLQPTNNYTTNLWKASYQLISRSNLSIARIPDIEMDEDLKNRLFGEARFLRALGYFNLVRLFGDVPLVLTPESDLDKYLVPRTASDSVYAQITRDLDFAAGHLPESYSGSNKGRVTKGAALGVLSKVYLTIEEWDLAALNAKAVKDMEERGVYGLWDDYAANFREVNKNGKESVFEVQFYTGMLTENCRIVISGLPSIFAFPAGVGIILPTEDLLNSFEPGDHRYESTFFSEYSYFGVSRFDPHIWKHWDQDVYPPEETGESGANFPVMRYAEVLLIYAEALNEANNGPTPEAYDAVNRVRFRARNGDPLVLPDLSDLSYDEFREAVWKEKRCETVNEGHRWFDLVRTGRLVERVKAAKGSKANPQPHNTVFPIPQRERDLNDYLSQNDNY
ncbi:MAG: RagB/SusD family nutrient uptake outer membrane protein [Bacteroidales bacterium]|nr:RagB/SusD family nutrient uptake outer membrane protein [Bacteroidales bacterium]MBN2699027.1 RagB/SusD family nutrient uptake outer membrane protein [Bacteroidales bacterium]